MPAANFTQHSFLGGEISPRGQGRSDQTFYRQSLKLCLNGLPIEESPWTRRPGFIDLGCTHLGRPAVIRSFHAGGQFGIDGGAAIAQGRSFIYLMELTKDENPPNLRLWIPQTDGYPTLLTEAAVGTITSFSAASPTLMEMSAAQTWVTGNTIIITVNSGAASNAANLRGRQLLVTKVSTTTFTLADAATGDAIDGTTISYAAGTAVAKEIVVLPSTQSVTLTSLRVLQSGTNVLFLTWLDDPWLATISRAPTPAVTFADANFKEADGPYLDALPGTSQTLNKTATATTADGLTYHITIGTDGATFLFAADDVGRCFRIWTQPAPWVAGTYTTDDTVTYNGVYWTCLAAGTTVAPGQPQAVAGIQTFPWLITPNLGKWTSSYITAVTTVVLQTNAETTSGAVLPFTSTTGVVIGQAVTGTNIAAGSTVLSIVANTSVTLSLDITGTVASGASITFSGYEADVRIAFNEETSPLVRLTIDAWQIGVYGQDIGFPATAGWFEGRLYLGGRPNRIDASMAGAFEAFIAEERPLFSPTDIYGNVFDDSAIARVIHSRDNASALWFEQDKQGMIFGTGNGEWLVSAGGDGIVTPTSAEVRKLSSYKAAFVDPVRVGSTVIFPQAAGGKVYEYLVDAFSNHYRALPLNRFSQHLAEENDGIQEMAYQEDPTPIVWATTGSIGESNAVRTPGDVLLGCTYRRVSDFATVPPEYNGWHQHTHGAGRAFFSIAIASVLQGQDALAAVTYDSEDTVYRVEVMSRLWGPA